MMQQSLFGAFVSWVGEHGAFIGGMGLLVVAVAVVVLKNGKGRD